MADNVTFEIDASVIAAFPEVEVLALRAVIPDQAALAPVVAGQAARIEAAMAEIAAVDPITALPEIARWRRAYGALGVKPSKFASSIEALLRRARKGQMADTGIPAVDLYNTVSVIHRAPMGAYDAARLSSDPLRLRQADPAADSFAPLGGDPASFPLNPELVVYAQGAGILCWGFNTRDSAATAVHEGSSDIVFFSETAAADGAAAAGAALESLAVLIGAGGGTAGPICRFSAARQAGDISRP
ncbi:B3/B4 domain-containing protein [Ovoidimarina sediminis]|uniref:B3/B4 domain-containing protein n=1 Tax=Ovoidimarina sediminis TaxID=3079856 RepID=UPI002912F2BF|nr:phenylalanine--tRNA ligase beta subunit-related protein [Rhodophyticola sp. MJ-SS7]MDU8945556.1 phenylalanine--tRNA ligase beta subunit-related protein [Rhodophyticola sp. MJ-SS7]